MPDIVGIRFKSCGKIYDFDANSLLLKRGDKIIIESEFGLSFGVVAEPPHAVENPQKDIKKVLRLASDEDYRQKSSNELFEQEAKSFCYERIMARGLPMKLVRAETTLDRKRIVFYFTADGRIDFRELVKDLAARFKTRIEMRQIGVRDKARLVGGFGLCGQELCCKTFLISFEPISIKMAKQQDLSLNAGKLSGACGRLMCCLGYEYGDGQKGPQPEGKSKRDLEETEASPEEPVTSEAGGEEVVEPADVTEIPKHEVVQDQQNQNQPGFHKKRRRRRRKKRPQKSE